MILRGPLPETWMKLLSERARLTPERVLHRYKPRTSDEGPVGLWKEVTARDFYERVRKLSLGLRERGVQAHARVGLVCSTRFEWTLVDHAIAGLRAVSVPVHPGLHPHDIRRTLESAQIDFLVVEDSKLLGLIPPTAYGYGSGRSELFQKRTSPMFDPVGAAEIAADMAISALLEPSRAARTINQNARNRSNPHFREVVTELVKTAWKSAPADANQVVIQRAVQSIAVSRLMDLAANERAQPQVRAVASDTLRSLLATLKKAVVTGEAAAFNRALADDITRFLERPDAPRKQTAPLATPPGDPIGN